MIINDLRVKSENIDKHIDNATHTGEGMTNSDRNDIIMS
jgi:hypothetical protein